MDGPDHGRPSNNADNIRTKTRAIIPGRMAKRSKILANTQNVGPNTLKHWPTLKTFGQTDKTLCESGQKILAKMKNTLVEHSKILAKQSKILAKNFIKFKSVYNFWERQFARSR